MKFCPECGKSLPSETSQFCDNCGAKINIVSQNVPSESAVSVNEEKSPLIAAICSFILPGLGQVYDGKTERGFGIFFGTLIGTFIFLIPGVIIWLFGVYDAYSLAEKMNHKEIPFLPTKTAHLLLFIFLALAVVAIVCVLFFIMVMAAALAPMAHTIR